jgi:hypothetical protein
VRTAVAFLGDYTVSRSISSREKAQAALLASNDLRASLDVAECTRQSSVHAKRRRHCRGRRRERNRRLSLTYESSISYDPTYIQRSDLGPKSILG